MKYFLRDNDQHAPLRLLSQHEVVKGLWNDKDSMAHDLAVNLQRTLQDTPPEEQVKH